MWLSIISVGVVVEAWVDGEYVGEIVSSEVLNDERTVQFIGLGRDTINIKESCIAQEKIKIGLTKTQSESTPGVLDIFNGFEYVSWHEVNVVTDMEFKSRKSITKLIDFMHKCVIPSV